MRTRSQPISPSGFQSLETAPRKKKGPAEAASKAGKPKKEVTRVTKGRPKKAPRKTVSQKLAAEKIASEAEEPQTANNVVEPTKAHASPAASTSIPGSSPPTPKQSEQPEQPVETTTKSELDISSTINPFKRLPRRILKPRLLRKVSEILSSPESLFSSPTQAVMERATRRAQDSAAAELILNQPSPGSLDSSGEECAPKCPCCSQVLTCPSGHSVWTNAGFRFMRRTKSLMTEPAESRKRGRQNSTENDDSDEEERASKRTQGDKSATNPARNPVVELHRRRRVTPFAERQRRRLAESQGRIDKTVFRIPELIAQNKADEEAARQAKTDNDDSSDDDAEVAPVVPFVRAADTPSRPRTSHGRRQQPGAPMTPSGRWNIGNLFSSVPRSISKLLPFREREDEEEVDPSIVTTPTPTPIRTAAPASAPASVPAPSPQQEQGTSEQKDSAAPAPSPDLSYSLFPKPLSWSPLNRSKSPAKEKQNTAVKDLESGRKAMPEESTPSNNRKRKREMPSIIPNPPGVSYGMHPDFFDSSSESDTEDEPQSNKLSEVQQPRLISSLKQLGTSKSPQTQTSKPVARTNAKEPDENPAAPQTPFRGILRMRKRVRFGPSPQDTPSKSRVRLFDSLPQETPVRPSTNNARASSLRHSESMPSAYIESPEDIVMTTPSPFRSSPGGRSPLAEKENEILPENFNTEGTFNVDDDVLYADDFFDNIPEDQIKGLNENNMHLLTEIREGKERRRKEREALEKQKSQASEVAQGKQPAEDSRPNDQAPVAVSQAPPSALQGQYDGSHFTHPKENVPTSPSKTPSQQRNGRDRTDPDFGSIVARRAISRSRFADDSPGVARPTRSLASLAPPSFYPAQVGGAAVERLRSELNEFQPKTPSALQIAERLASSPLAAPSPLAGGTGAGAPNSPSFGWPSATPIACPRAGQPFFERLKGEFGQALRSR